VQLISENQTPWWWGGALTGSFVVIAALVAFFSLKASDRRKLSREDRRQWDVIIKDGFISTSTAMNSLVLLSADHTDVLDEDAYGEVVAQAESIRLAFEARRSEWELIAADETVAAFIKFARAAGQYSETAVIAQEKDVNVLPHVIALTELRKAVQRNIRVVSPINRRARKVK
jgi:hypothetical protein